MATRSYIAKKNVDGSIKQIYCHWDGYPDNNGRLLLEHYNTEEKVDELLALGDISSLREKASPKEGETHTFENPQDDVTIAYGRDRGEENTQAKFYGKHESRPREEWNYLFKDGEWMVSRDATKNYIKLKEYFS